jgi:hypothetical protein
VGGDDVPLLAVLVAGARIEHLYVVTGTSPEVAADAVAALVQDGRVRPSHGGGGGAESLPMAAGAASVPLPAMVAGADWVPPMSAAAARNGPLKKGFLALRGAGAGEASRWVAVTRPDGIVMNESPREAAVLGTIAPDEVVGCDSGAAQGTGGCVQIDVDK